MILTDVNVLVYAHRRDATDHDRYREWLARALVGPEPFGVSDQVLAGALRVLTHPRVFAKPTAVATAQAFADAVRSHPNAVRVAPGRRHWGVFTELCRASDARGNLVADAFLAALAIEAGCLWVTTDRDFARFPALRWRHPLAEA